MNIDTKPLDNPHVRTLVTDITDGGQLLLSNRRARDVLGFRENHNWRQYMNS